MLAKQILILCIIGPFIEYYGFVAVRKAVSGLNKKFRLILLFSYLILSIAVIWGFFAFRQWATTEWPSVLVKTVVSLLIAVFFGKFLIAMLMLIGDAFLLFKTIGQFLFSLPERSKGKLPKGKPITRSQFISRTALLCGALFTSGLGFGMTNRYKYQIRRVQVPLTGLPPVFKQLKMIQISDIHAGSFDNADAVNHGMDMVLNENPDIILFTGDLVNYRSSEIESFKEIFARLKAPLGVYSILGNHDYGDYLTWPSDEDKKADFERIKNYHKTLGWNLLTNENVVLDWKGSPLALIGSENWSIKDRFPKYGDLNKAMAGLENRDIPLKIVMTHDPSHWDAEIRPNFPDVRLTFSGHTHGFQMGIEIPGIRWSPAQYLYKQWAGLYREKDQFLYVNRGFGFIGYNGRLGILPEITVVEIV